MSVAVIARALALTLTLASASCGVDTSTGPGAVGQVGACSVVAVHSDFVSTAVSLLNPDGTLCVDSLVTSGSAALDVLAALSGDVVVPSSLDPEGRVVLVDRYPHAVVSLIEVDPPADVSQVSVAMGYAANPHDVAFLGDGRAYVARLASNGSPAPGAGGLDKGGDLLIVDVALLEPMGRVALPSDDGFEPMPSRVVPLGDRVWVTSSHLARDFSTAGPGRVLGVDPVTDEVVSVVSLDGLENCSSATPSLDSQGLWVSCSGLLASSEAAQTAASGLVYLGLEGGELVEQWRVSAESSLGGPVAWSIASVSPGVAIFTVFGSLAEGTPDRLVWADRSAGLVHELGVEGTAFELGGLLWSPDDGVLMVADAAPEAPSIRRFTLGDAALTELEPIDGSPSTGLPPRHLAFFR